jgi:hypothetical protein
MVDATKRAPKPNAVPGWGRSIVAGAGAGVVAALVSVGAVIVMHAHTPPRDATFWSAFVAGILGGILYGWLGHLVPCPVAALWVITLVIATIDSLLIAIVPAASGPNPSLGIPIQGLTAPLRQLLALVGVGHLGTRHLAAGSLLAHTITHYFTAVAVSLLVPWWAKPKNQ